MATVTRTTTWSDNQVLTATALNGEFNNLLNAINIVNADISGSASITFSKLDSTTVAGVSASQTLTNKTLGTGTVLTKPIITASIQTVNADSDAATITFDMSVSNIHNVTLGGNRTLAVSNVSTGQVFTIILKQGSGSQTVTWWGSIKWTGGSAPTLTTTGSQYDIFVFIYDGTNYYGSIAGQGYA